MKKSFYAVFSLEKFNGKVVSSWNNVPSDGVVYQKFSSELAARGWIKWVADHCASLDDVQGNSVFFDSGTLGTGCVEVSVVDSQYRPLLKEIFHESFLNDWGNLVLSPLDYTNNFGELFSAFCAAQIVSRTHKVAVGDSLIVLFYWLSPFFQLSPEKLNKHTFEIAKRTRILVDKNHLRLKYANREWNKADLGVRYEMGKEKKECT